MASTVESSLRLSREMKSKLVPHVLIFPLPAQGHINSMLNLAQLLCLAQLDVTFIVSDFIHRRLLQHTYAHRILSRFPGFRFQTITDGLPDDHPRAGEIVMDLIPSVINITGPLFKKMMVEKDMFASADRRPVTCMIADGVLKFAAELAAEKGIPLIYFRTVSACAFWSLFCVTEVIEAGEMPIQGNGMDELVHSIPGMKGILRRRDLPSFCRVDDVDDHTLINLVTMTRQSGRAQGFILNTFQDLEEPVLSSILKSIPRVFTIGPSILHLKSRLAEKTDGSMVSSSLWAEDQSCIDWLDAQEQRSVIYVSFGSITVVTREQLLELWHGLVNSGQKFLWVMRPDSIVGKDEHRIPEELENGTKENGYMVEWAPQEKVLNHPSVGGFLTHSGWNSTIESIVAGVPMICWPYFADQTVNSRFVSEVWRIGFDIKDTCDRVEIENVVKKLMQERKNEFLERASHWAKLAKEAISEGGSSYNSLDDLVQYIRSFII